MKLSFVFVVSFDIFLHIFIRALIQSSGIKGEVTLSQRSPFDPAWIRMNLTSISDKHTGQVTKVSAYKIHELPPVPLQSVNVKENHCLKTGSVFNPSNIQEDQGLWESHFYVFKGTYVAIYYIFGDRSCCLQVSSSYQ
jgi:hypothetical protein